MEGAHDSSSDLSFLAGGGEVGALMRAHDWSGSVLGAPAAWPQSLRSVVGLLLSSKFPMFVAWGNQLGFLYNDPYAEILGAKHPAALGARFQDIWSEIWSDISPLIDAALAGEASFREDLPLVMNRRGFDEQTWFTFSYSPVRDESGRIAGMFCAVAETTGKVLAERRLSFLVQLSDMLQSADSPLKITITAAEALGRHLGVGRAGYGEIVGNGEVVAVERDWSDGRMSSLAGEARILDAFGPQVIAELRAGRTLVVQDCRTDPRTADPAYLPSWDGIGTRALIVVPLLRESELSAILYAHSAAPRIWSPVEVALVEDVATRTWSAHAQAQAEAAQRASEVRLRRAHAAARLGDWIWDVETGATTMSGEYPRLLGLPADALPDTADRFFEMVHPDDRARLAAEAAPLLAGEVDRFDTEFRIVRGDGQTAWLASSAQAEGRLPDGRAARIVGVNYDVTERKRAEEALRESEARFRNMADHAPVMMWVTEPDGWCSYLNRGWYEFTGQSEAEALGFGWLEATHPDDKAEAERVFREANAARAPFRVEYRLRRNDGVYRWAIDTAAPRFGDDGAFRGYVGSVIDIDERREAEARLRTLADALPAFVWFAAPDGALRYLNDRWYEYTGQTADVALPHGWALALHPDDAERTAERWSDALARGVTYEIEMRYRRRDGAYRWYVARAEPLRDAAGAITTWFGTSTDIHDRKLAEDALRELNETLEDRVADRTVELIESERRFRAIFDTTFQLTGLAALDGTILVVNRAALDAAKTTQAQVASKKIWDSPWWAASPAESRRLREEVARVAAGEFVRYESELTLPDGHRVFDFSMKPVLDDAGRPAFLIAEARDITEQKRAEAALRQAQKMEAVGQLTGGIAHDFNNLLGAVVGSLDLIRRRSEDPERVRRWAEHGLNAAERGAKLTGQLLAFSRAQRVESKPLVLSDLVGNMRDMLARTLGPMIRLTFSLDETRARVLSDPTQLEMAVLNLAINARDAMPEGGELIISTQPRRLRSDPELDAGDYVELAVQDTGVGMTPEVLAKAFDPFFTTKGVGEGTGLGLSQVYGIARQARGTVRIESAPGRGTTVRVYLPKTDAVPDASGAAKPDERIEARSATVLVVDDDPELRRVLADQLDELGYQVREAVDGLSALEALASGAPDLLMVDFAMPEMNGADLAKAARARWPDLPIVFASGYAETAAIEQVMGPDAVVLRKPFRVGDLQAVLADALGESGAGRASGDRPPSTR